MLLLTSKMLVTMAIATRATKEKANPRSDILQEMFEIGHEHAADLDMDAVKSDNKHIYKQKRLEKKERTHDSLKNELDLSTKGNPRQITDHGITQRWTEERRTE